MINKTIAAAFLIAASVLISCKKEHTQTTIQQYAINTDSSSVEWKGFLKTGYFNEGSVSLESTSIQVKDGIVSGGFFRMPLSTLKNFNLPTDTLKEQLLHHLKSADFFNVLMYPDLTFRISNVITYSGQPGQAIPDANYLVTGDFTMLGLALPVTFPAKITIDQNRISVDASLKIDRTKWGMNYATSDTLEDESYIMPEVDIKLRLKGKAF